MTKKRKILYISGTRADYGLMRPTLDRINKHPRLKLEIVVTGMHLMPEFGKTLNEIKKDDFKIHRIKAIYKEDNKESMAKFIGRFIQLLTEKLKKIKPDIILILGDREEMLAGAIVGAYLGIPLVHIAGGDVTTTVDEVVRHAITKLSNIHLTANKKARERVIKMGEDAWRVYIVGAPGVDGTVGEKLLSKKEIEKKFKVNSKKPILLVLQHPVSIDSAASDMKETMEAVKELRYQTIVIYPNADAGGRKMIKVIEKYRKYPFIKIYKNILHKDFLSLMIAADAIVGNSSSGLTEAPSFKLPVVNVGIRQQGRDKADNVIEVEHDKNDIIKAIQKAFYDEKFKEKVKKCKNPYGQGKANERIVAILNSIKIDKKLLQKKLAY